MIKNKLNLAILNNKNGIALLMVLSSIVILSTILISFTFDTHINKLKVANSQDKFQARLNSEAGVNLAMAKLKLYQHSRNLLAKNKTLKKMVNNEMINQLWSMPFVFPIPIPKSTSVHMKEAIEEFTQDSVIKGSMRITILNISNKINLNLLRIDTEKKSQQKNNSNSSNDTDDQQDNELKIDSELIDLISRALESKNEEDDLFAQLYRDVEPKKIVSSIKYFISDKDSFNDQYTGDFKSNYNRREVSPKHAPLASLSELYLIDGLNDDLIELFADEITVHGGAIVDLNKLTSKGLKFLFPKLENEQVKEFFEFRDDPEDPQDFNSVKNFKNYIVRKVNFVSESDFDKRMKQFEKAGIKFGTAGTLFKIISVGEYGRTKYTTNAFVSIPAKPPSKKTLKDKGKRLLNTKTGKYYYEKDLSDPNHPLYSANKKKTKSKKKKPILQLLEPRIVEIFIN